MPPLSPDEFEALKSDIRDRGILIPIEVDEDRNILDGHHRCRAWEELRAEGAELPDYPRVVRAGMTEAQKRNHIRALNIVRRQLSSEQRRELWAAMRADGMTYEEIANETGVGETTVRRAVPPNGGTQPAAVTGKDGKRYPPKKKRKPKPTAPPAAPPVSVYAGSDEGEGKAALAARRKLETPTAASQPVQVTIFSSESEEYYTPPQYVNAAREVMGGIDLDPASHSKPQEWIEAKFYLTTKDDGLTHPWYGRVWLNPPYGKEGGGSSQERWSQKLIAEYRAGNVTEAVLLVKAAMGYNWFEELWWNWPTCFAKERISFIRPDGDSSGQSKMGTAFIYLGHNVGKFTEVFRQFGRVIMPDNDE
jgi:hypothetical protein